MGVWAGAFQGVLAYGLDERLWACVRPPFGACPHFIRLNSVDGCAKTFRGAPPFYPDEALWVCEDAFRDVPASYLDEALCAFARTPSGRAYVLSRRSIMGVSVYPPGMYPHCIPTKHYGCVSVRFFLGGPVSYLDEAL